MTNPDHLLIPAELLEPIGADPRSWGTYERRIAYGCVMAWLSCGNAKDTLGAVTKLLLASVLAIEKRIESLPVKKRVERERLGCLGSACRKFISENESSLLRAYPVSVYKRSIVWEIGKKKNSAPVEFRRVMTVGEIVLMLIRKDPSGEQSTVRTITGARSALSDVKGYDLYRKATDVQDSLNSYRTLGHLCAAYRLFIQHHGLDLVTTKSHKELTKNIGEIVCLSQLIAARLDAVVIKKKPYRQYYELVEASFVDEALQECAKQYGKYIDFEVPKAGT